MSASGGFLDLGNLNLEYQHTGPSPEQMPTLVLLHEGLGCVELWGDFAQRLAEATGCGVFAYSRAGYGTSSPVTLPRPLDYMQREAELLPRILDAIGFRQGILVGHSDGASIATIYAGAYSDHRIKGISLIAPHFVVEEMTVAAIAEAKTAYETSDLRQRLARWHRDVDNAFYGWNAAWLDPEFRHFDITASLSSLPMPVQIIQGEQDQYGTVLQIEIAQKACSSPPQIRLLPGVRHSPHREAKLETIAGISAFVTSIRMKEQS